MTQHQPRVSAVASDSQSAGHRVFRSAQLTTIAVFTPLHHVRRIAMDFSRTQITKILDNLRNALSFSQSEACGTAKRFFPYLGEQLGRHELHRPIAERKAERG